MIKYRDFVKKAMPEEKTRITQKDILAHYILKPIAHVFAIPLCEWGASPNAVTWLSLFPALLAGIIFNYAKTVRGFMIGWVFLWIWNLMDAIDGDIARYAGKSTNKGALLDATIGWFAYIVMYNGAGFAAYRVGGFHILGDMYLNIGALTGTFVIFPRLIMHKKAGLAEKNVTKEWTELRHENMRFTDIIKMLVYNFVSLNGLGIMLFPVCLLTGCIEFYVILSFIVNLVVMVASVLKLLADW